MHRFYCLLLLIGGLSPALPAQIPSLTPAYPQVSGAAGADLPLAWLGGLNAPQYQAADLDGDGDQDLYIFDRAGNAQLALRSDGNGSYEEAPELTANFPADLVEWTLLRDYDGDGTTDLFTYAPAVGGIRVFRGARDTEGLLTFSLLDFGEPLPQLYYPLDNGTTTPIFVSNIDYPAVDDIDMDGDLDILTFSVGGGFVEYYQNQSVERGFGTDSLIYILADECWGGFFESGLTSALDLAAVPGDCFVNLSGERPVRPRHVGSTLLAVDLDGNGLKDILLGDISFEFISTGFNTGSLQEAFISRQDSTWPADGTPVNIDFFPAAFHLDIDQDGLRDIVAAPTQTLNVEDVDVGWYYRNEGTASTPNFVFQDSQLFVRDMIDFGTGARPAVFDYDADGRPDLVIGNNEQYTRDISVESQVRLFRNVTPPGGPVAFEFVDADFLDLVQFQRTTWAFAPTFGDLDGDGDQDAVVGERAGFLIFLENLAGPDQPARFGPAVFEWMGIDAGQFSIPDIIDLDRDGLPDLVVGGFDGRIRYYRNVGTATEPMFLADETAGDNQLQLGGVNTRTPGFSTGHPTPIILDYEDRFLLLTGNRAGTLEAYAFTEPTQAFDQLTDTIGELSFGSFSQPTVADFDGDGMLEMVVGTERGGVTYFTTDLEVDATVGLFEPPGPAFEFTVYPNPVTDRLFIGNWAGTRVEQLRLLDATGRVVRSLGIRGQGSATLQLDNLPAGIYTVMAVAPEGIATRKVVRP